MAMTQTLLMTAINSALFLLRAVLNDRIQSKIEALALQYETLPQLEGESKRAYNDRRRALVIETIQRTWPALRTALIEAVLALIVMRLTTK